jgi:hypothetical protein
MKKLGFLLVILTIALLYSFSSIIADNDSNRNSSQGNNSNDDNEDDDHPNLISANNDSDDNEDETEDDKDELRNPKCDDYPTYDNCICKEGVKKQVPCNNSSGNNTGCSAIVTYECINKDKLKNRNLTRDEIKEVVKEKNRIGHNKTSECPEKCTCTGVVMKCELENGREMTIIAGNSGNIIIQQKMFNASTQVELYKSNGTVYGTFKNNVTREIKVLPEELQQKILDKLKARLDQANVTLDENGIYKVKFQKNARVFFIFPVKEDVSADVDSSTGEFVVIKKPWWGFLAKDINNSQ